MARFDRQHQRSHAAVVSGKVDSVTLLLEATARVNDRDCLGRTPAILVAQMKHDTPNEQQIRQGLWGELEKLGANFTLTDNQGFSAQDYMNSSAQSDATNT